MKPTIVDANHNRVLFVLNDRTIGDVLKLTVNQAGFRSKCVFNGRHLLSHLSTNLFQCLVIAEPLTDVDSWRIIRIVRSGRFCDKTLPVVLLFDDYSSSTLASAAGEYGICLHSADELEPFPTLLKCLIDDHETAKPRALVIEDNSDSAELARHGLKTHYRVDMAYDGINGIEQWQATRHDLVVLDLQLPDLPGREVLKRIHAIDPSQVIIIITAYGTDELHQDLMLSGAAEFLGKPINPQELRHTCAQILRDSADAARYQSYIKQRRKQQNAGKHVWLAQHMLETGRAGLAGEHLKHAQTLGQINYPSDDEWAELLSQYD